MKYGSGFEFRICVIMPWRSGVPHIQDVHFMSRIWESLLEKKWGLIQPPRCIYPLESYTMGRYCQVQVSRPWKRASFRVPEKDLEVDPGFKKFWARWLDLGLFKRALVSKAILLNHSAFEGVCFFSPANGLHTHM